MNDAAIISDATADAKRLLAEPGVAAVVAALRAGGGEVRFVGGCVRDCLLGVTSDDIDLATDLVPNDVTKALQTASLKAIPTGIEHGTVTAVSEHRGIEVTTLRRDVSTDGRRAVVAFTRDWREDASRRDFTINALSLTPEGALHDYFGGRADLKAGHVRFIGDAVQRIAEDGLRILRFFRFYARFAKEQPDAKGLVACAEKAAMLDSLSGERIRVEMLKLLEARGAVAALRAMQSCDLFSHLLMEGVNLERLEELIALENGIDFSEPSFARAIRHLAAIFQGKSTSSLAERWKLSNKERETLSWLAATPVQPLTEDSVKRRIRQEGRDNALSSNLISAPVGTDTASLLSLQKNWPIPVFPVTGEDLKKHGFASGPELGQALKRLETLWEDSGYNLTKEALLKKL